MISCSAASGDGGVEQRGPHVGDGRQPAAARLALLVEAGVVDGDAGGAGQRGEHGLVLGGELAVRFSVMYRLPNTSPRTRTGTPRKERHRRVVRREADGRRVLAQVGDAQRIGLGDQLAEDALALRQVAHPGAQLVVDADVDERRQTAASPEHAERPVPGVDEVGGGLDDAAQRAVQVQARSTRSGTRRAGAAPAPGCGRPRPAVLDLVEQFGQPHPGQRGPGSPRLLVASGRVPSGTSLLHRAWQGDLHGAEGGWG